MSSAATSPTLATESRITSSWPANVSSSSSVTASLASLARCATSSREILDTTKAPCSCPGSQLALSLCAQVVPHRRGRAPAPPVRTTSRHPPVRPQHCPGQRYPHTLTGSATIFCAVHPPRNVRGAAWAADRAAGKVPRMTLEALSSVSFLIRVQIPDRPGSLGAVATALGEIGADILSLDVVERGNGAAVDDMVVELPSGRLPDVLITAAESVEGVQVDAVRPYAGVLNTRRELELVEEI